MKITKPMRLALMKNAYQWQGRYQLGVSVMAMVTMRDDTPSLLIEPDLWNIVGEYLGEDDILDMGLPKPAAEFLVSGSAWTSHQEDKTQCAVRARVGNVEKDLLVFGDRYWKN